MYKAKSDDRFVNILLKNALLVELFFFNIFWREKTLAPFHENSKDLPVVFLGNARAWYFIWMHIAQSTDAKAITPSAQVGWQQC